MDTPAVAMQGGQIEQPRGTGGSTWPSELYDDLIRGALGENALHLTHPVAGPLSGVDLLRAYTVARMSRDMDVREPALQGDEGRIVDCRLCEIKDCGVVAPRGHSQREPRKRRNGGGDPGVSAEWGAAMDVRRHVVRGIGLADALRDPEPLVRGHAAWALGRLGGSEARAALAAAHPVERDPLVCEELRLALRECDARGRDEA